MTISRTKMLLDLAGATVNGITLLALEFDVEAQTSRFEDENKADPAWSYTDTHGHFHAWALGRTGPFLPTLIAGFVTVPCDGSCGGRCDGDGYERTQYNCTMCGDPVEPGRRQGWHTIVGRTFYTAFVTGPAELAELDGIAVSLVCAAGFGTGFLHMSEMTMSTDVVTVQARIPLRDLHDRLKP